MSKKKTTIIVAVVAFIAVIAVLVAVGLAHRNQNTTGQAKPAASQSASHAPAPTATEDTPTFDGKLTDTYMTNTAITIETTMRNWGTDPNIDLKALAKQPAADVLDALHTKVPETNPVKESGLLSYSRKDAGPQGPSQYCEQGMEMLCAQNPKAYQWLPNEAWTYGSRWIEGPTAAMSGEDSHTVRVTGKVRAILLQDGDTFHGPDYWALTPAWKTYTINDTIRFDDDGKIAYISDADHDYWWINPYLMSWTDQMPESLGRGAERIAIPVKGQPNMILHHMGGARVLRAPETQADLGGDVDWSLWDGICMASCGNQQQGFTESPDGLEH